MSFLILVLLFSSCLKHFIFLNKILRCRILGKIWYSLIDGSCYFLLHYFCNCKVGNRWIYRMNSEDPPTWDGHICWIEKIIWKEFWEKFRLLEVSLNRGNKHEQVPVTPQPQPQFLPFTTSFSMLSDTDCLFQASVIPNMFSPEDFKLSVPLA